MATASAIEWTESTWNPIRGCTRISPGCEHCYAERMAHRLSGPGKPYEGLTRRHRRRGPSWTGIVRIVPELIEEPLRWARPRRVFVNSMSDLFHEGAPADFITHVFDVMRRAHWHEFQVLTKRAERILEVDALISWPANVWMGVSVESDRYRGRIEALRQCSARVKFLSLEPLLGPLRDLDLEGIDWAIVGGESGPGARPMDPAWVLDLRDQCQSAGVAFFFKQWGGVRKKRTGRELEGRTWDEYPRPNPPRARPQ